MFSVAKVWRPAWFQGRLQSHSYFEGWYFKSVSADGLVRLAVIPGVSLTASRADRHCFVQINDSGRGRSAYFRWPLSEFESAPDSFDVRVGRSRFSLHGFELNIEKPEGCYQGRLDFTGVRGWPVRLLAPGAMGPFRFVPQLECYHGVISFDHEISGRLLADGTEYDFTGGRGYAEKDWGRSMPDAWIWLQCNHFDAGRAGLSVSVARVPWLGASFTGHIVGLRLGDRLFEFVTWNGSKLTQVAVNDNAVRLGLHRGRRRLEIEAERTPGATLAAPQAGAMTGRISETLDAVVRVRLLEGDEVVFAGAGRYAGLEVVGDITRLVPVGSRV